MRTAGWLFIIIAALMFQAAAKGRNLVETFGDVMDAFIAVLLLKTTDLKAISARTGQTQTVSMPAPSVSTVPDNVGGTGSANVAESNLNAANPGGYNAAGQWVSGIIGAATNAAGGTIDGVPIRNTKSAPQDDIVRLGLALQSGAWKGRKIRVGEHPKFGGVHPVHVNGSYHYKTGGQALDLNYDGQSVSESKCFDELAPVLVRAGWRVIWRATGHYDHIHVDTGPAGRVVY